MSANPQLARIPDEELDLLLSRSLDGDLSPEEERDLDRYLTGHPEARQRRDALASVVADLRKIPPRDPPFALATRVHANVTEKSAGIASVWHRFGIYPAAGVVPALAGVLALGLALAVYYDVKRPIARPAAEQAQKADDGKVEVFFQETTASKKASPESQVAAKGGDAAAPAAPAPPAPAVVAGRIQDERAAREKDQDQGARPSLPASRPATTLADAGARPARSDGPVDTSSYAAEPERPIVVAEAPQPRPERSEEKADGSADRAGEKLAEKTEKRALARNEAPALATRRDDATGFAKDKEATRQAATAASSAAAPAGLAAPAPPAASRRWTVAVAIGSDSWQLARPPAGNPSAPLAATAFRLTLDAEGRVTSVRASLPGGEVRTDVDAMLRSLSFTSTGRGREREVEVRVEAR